MRNTFTKLGFLVVLIVGISATTINNDRLYEISKNIEIFVNVYKELNANYVDDLDPSELMRTGIDAMVNSLDPYTNYISESQVASYRINTEGKYQGIGAIVKKVDDYVTIIEPYQGSPVIAAGLMAGDQIIEIQGKSTKGKSTEEMTQIVRGVPGTSINMTINRPTENKQFKVDLERAEVSVPNVPYAGIIGEDIAYVVLTTFTANASKNIRDQLLKLKADNPNLKGVILDLRNNGGGLLREAINVSNLFIPKNLEIVSVRSKVKERDVSYKTMAEPTFEDIPLVVMINKKSASASEIVSGVIQDLDRGVLMGQRSFGKGLVQNTKDIGYNNRVKLTTSKYYIPSGRCIQAVEYDEGEPVDIPNEKRAKFKTSVGRTVLDGGGVSPDIYLENNGVPEIVNQLEKKNMFFKYINTINDKYSSESEEPVEVSFSDYLDFVNFVKKSDFEYKSKNTELFEKIKKNLKTDQQLSLVSEVEAIENKINQEQDLALEIHKQLILNTIEEKISARQHFQKGKFFQKLKNDTEIVEAIDLLHSSSEYNQIIRKG